MFKYRRFIPLFVIFYINALKYFISPKIYVLKHKVSSKKKLLYLYDIITDSIRVIHQCINSRHAVWIKIQNLLPL